MPFAVSVGIARYQMSSLSLVHLYILDLRIVSYGGGTKVREWQKNALAGRKIHSSRDTGIFLIAAVKSTSLAR